MFGLVFHLPSRADLKAREEQRLQRIAKAVPWRPDIPWSRELNIKADTYLVRHFFDGQETLSKSGLWRYSEQVLPKGRLLATLHGSRHGTVLFDGSVLIPRLHRRDDEAWSTEPFMSLTPMEMLTLRAGVRLATGHVVIAGLGLGHQAIEVSRKKTVKKITIVEKCSDLVDFVWPEVQKHVGDKPIEMIVGDAYEVLPKLTANIALVDIFPTYGSNRFEVRDLEPDRYSRKSNRSSERYSFGWKPVPCPTIKKVWVWGAADVKGDGW